MKEQEFKIWAFFRIFWFVAALAWLVAGCTVNVVAPKPYNYYGYGYRYETRPYCHVHRAYRWDRWHQHYHYYEWCHWHY